MMTKDDLKKWLDEDNTNRMFIRRIGMPQYRLVDIIDVKELKDIKAELDATIRNLRFMQDLRTMKSSEWMNTLYRHMHTSSFTDSNWKLMRSLRENNPTMLSDISDFRCWRTVLLKYLGQDNNWWLANYEIAGFYKNVRLYLRNKMANKIARENKVYTVNRDMTYVLSVSSKFDIQWKREKIYAGTPMFFVERDYAGRMIFMAGTQTFALGLVQVQKVRELKEVEE